MLEAKGIVKRFGEREVLRSVDLTLKPGETVALLGPNGAGKTTFMKVLATLLRPEAGSVFWNGREVHEDSQKWRGRIGVVGHLPFTYDHLTVRENLLYYAAMYSMPKPKAREETDRLLKQLHLEHRGDDRSGILSAGMKQRLAIARAVLHSPQVLFLDEPFSNLDVKGCDVLISLLQERRSQGASVLLITHDLEKASQIADRAEILVEGKVCSSLDADCVRGDLKHRYACAMEGKE